MKHTGIDSSNSRGNRSANSWSNVLSVNPNSLCENDKSVFDDQKDCLFGNLGILRKEKQIHS